ncbi:GNAT family N-acetyltransferase [Sphingomonas sp. 35-24ZXX]|uniref:GNAT family N-acetyltransferase n=1 Tax=Sphingomonas sp. 35-24ZXX TaxID=1545915 RepID=UPI00068F7174|nr:GNAT family N-acetyltransferase [Sphingomonas sp. 35-24ZXX]
MRIRAATPADIPVLEQLIAASARQLSIGHYGEAETEAAIAHVFGVDSELVEDGTYLIVESDGRLAGCGGWSRRATLFGSDRFAARASGYVDPAVAPAKIRAFFVAPEFARRGVGTVLLQACEDAAVAAGFTSAELMATLPGVPFYEARGYVAGSAITQIYDGVGVRFVPMHKLIHQQEDTRAYTDNG